MVLVKNKVIQFFDLKIIKKIDDIFQIHKNKKIIINLDGWGELSFNNLIQFN